MYRLIPPLCTPEVVALRRMTVLRTDQLRDSSPVPAPFIIVSASGRRVDSFLSASAAKRELRRLNALPV